MKRIFLIELKKRNERIYFQKNRLVIPDDDEIRLKILQLIHDSFNAKHPEKTKQFDIIKRAYW